jgi:hypothetical protein
VKENRAVAKVRRIIAKRYFGSEAFSDVPVFKDWGCVVDAEKLVVIKHGTWRDQTPGCQAALLKDGRVVLILGGQVMDPRTGIGMGETTLEMVAIALRWLDFITDDELRKYRSWLSEERFKKDKDSKRKSFLEQARLLGYRVVFEGEE